ncbi:PREDICTED: carbohydrate sulfotransferase 5-like [Nanorana parkeri]|uniref:carbohydrate sulfotransferase 5-like n=1 Tax=Nanorana parkeri TaxID=125878 RepID=UPI00085446D5|nr:PREDICTED: carbohydrate sulfotransferase 5-like [Nanorana parkeri]
MVRVRIISCVLAVLICVHILLLLLHLQKVKKTREKEKVHLLILSTWRSGSSLVGQLFSQHPNVFYLMEPAWHVWKTMSYSSGDVLHMAVRDLVRSVFKCDMSVFDAYANSNMKVSDLFLWYSSRALCAPPACDYFSHDEMVNVTACRQLCRNVSIGKAEEACSRYSHIVVKEVRFFNLRVLYPLLKDPSLNLKILHLVRDPRAVAKSRRQTLTSLAVDNGIVLNTKGTKNSDARFLVLRKICQSHANMYKMAIDDPPEFLKGRYMMVRYEDLVRDPLREVQEMYKFANLGMTDKLGDWIHNITHGQGPPKRNEAFEITPRDALNVSQAWRSVLPFQIVRQIQGVCKDAMNTFRYQFMKSETQQRDLSEDFILPRTEH